MDKYTLVILEEDKSTADALMTLLQDNPLYNCIRCHTTEELNSVKPSPTLCIINPQIPNISPLASKLQKSGCGVILLAEDGEGSDLYGIDSVYPIIAKPLRNSEIVSTVALTIQNMKTSGELVIYSRFSTLLNKTVELLQNSAKSSLDEALRKILQLLCKEFKFDIIGLRIRDDQFAPTFKEILLSNGKFLSGENSLFCHGHRDGDMNKICFCELMRSVPEEKLRKIGTPNCSVWTNDTHDFIDEIAHQDLSLTLSPRCAKVNYQSLASIRIKANDELIGLFTIGHNSPGALNENTIRFFEDLSSTVGELIWHRQLEENLKAVHTDLENAPVLGNIAMWKYAIETDTFTFSEEFYNLTKSPKRDGKNSLSDFLISIQYDDRERVLECFNKLIKKEQEYTHCEFRFRNIDSKKLKYFKIFLSFNEKGGCINGALEDITDKEVALLTEKNTKDFLNSILDGINAAIIVIDPLLNSIVDVNKRTEELFEKSPEELMTIKGTHFLSTRFFRKNVSLVTQRNDNQSAEELLFKKPDSTIIPILRNIITTSWHGRKHYVVIIFDITDRKDLERQLNHAQKMESIGSLAAGIAHEINTPMQYIGDNLGFVKDSMEAYTSLIEKLEHLCSLCKEQTLFNEEIKEIDDLKEELDMEFLNEETPLALEQAQDGVERVTKIVKAMKKFSHPGEEEMALYDINDIIKNTVIVAKNAWKYNCDLIEDLEVDFPLIYCNGNDISQVILNMVVNASHAIEDVVKETGTKGKITICTKSYEKHIHILISDTGSGIAPENYANIFNPFFTTKEVGKGTGQGLSMAYSIVTEKHKGKLSFTSELGVGTEFTIELPLIKEAPNA